MPSKYFEVDGVEIHLHFQTENNPSVDASVKLDQQIEKIYVFGLLAGGISEKCVEVGFVEVC